MRRLVVALVSSMAVLLVLCGCTAGFESAIKRTPDGSFTFHYCHQLEGNTVRVVGITKSNEYVNLWKASSVSVGTVPTTIPLGNDFEDFKGKGEVTDLGPYTALNVLVQTTKDGALSESQGAIFKIASISQDHWLRSDGSTAETACASN